ncbi:MAG: hypothetical protein HY903_08515 [Deltaproteobacteria bacterium]|nr:hypothetical protein [Deltaproteobacteria bacterium]
MRTVIAALLLGLLLSSGVALAQEGGDKVSFKKRTVIDFSDALIEGELTKPEGSYVVSRKLSRFSSLIRLRENFIPELLASPAQL